MQLDEPEAWLSETKAILSCLKLQFHSLLFDVDPDVWPVLKQDLLYSLAKDVS